MYTHIFINTYNIHIYICIFIYKCMCIYILTRFYILIRCDSDEISPK